jgi:type IV pilus assembly protein PilW
MSVPTDNLNVRNPYGYRPGDLVLLQDPGTANNCSIMEVTATPASVPPAAPGNVAHANSTYTVLLGAGVTQTARFNPAGGLGVTYNGTLTNATLVFDLGNIYEPAGAPDLPVHNTYSIVNRSLTVTSLFVPTLPAASPSPVVNTVADNLVHMRALYGVDTGPYDTNGYGDGIVDSYVDAATFNGMNLNGFTPPWRYVIAVRVAVVARSALAEKPSEGASGCDATTDGTETPPGADRRPKWTPAGPVTPPPAQVPFNLTTDPDWKCYRYRVFETTVPLRNWIWRSN